MRSPSQCPRNGAIVNSAGPLGKSMTPGEEVLCACLAPCARKTLGHAQLRRHATSSRFNAHRPEHREPD